MPLKTFQPRWRVDFSSSEREVSEAAKILSSQALRFKGSTVFGLRATMYEVGVDASLSLALATLLETLPLLIIGSSLVGAASATARMEARKRVTGANSIMKGEKNLIWREI